MVVDESRLWPTHRFSTTVMVASVKFINAHPDAVEALVDDNREIIDWINSHPGDAKELANAQIAKLAGKALSSKIIDSAWPRLHFSSQEDKVSLIAFAGAAKDAGYIPADTQIDDRIWLPPLETPPRQMVASVAR
jgi:NitT/TauT family transport system substrate-binding protein